MPCYVLADKRRVVVQRGVMDALDMSQGTAGRGGGDRLAKFVATKSLNPFVSNELATVITNPIIFQTPTGARAYGYEATVLADLCDAERGTVFSATCSLASPATSLPPSGLPSAVLVLSYIRGSSCTVSQ